MDIKNYLNESYIVELIKRGENEYLTNQTDLAIRQFENFNCLYRAVKYKQVLLNAYHKLKTMRIPLDHDTEKTSVNSIIKLHFFINEKTVEKLNDSDNGFLNKNQLLSLFDKYRFKIISLAESILKTEEVNNEFIECCVCIANNVNVAKKLCKLLVPSNRFEKSMCNLILPWEQIQFALIAFVVGYSSAFKNQSVFYGIVLTKTTLTKHLDVFTKDLRALEANHFTGCKDKFKSNYKELFDDYWSIKNIYSLDKINNYIELGTSIGYDGHLSLERCLFVIGEYTKSSPESPHLSPRVRKSIVELSPKDLPFMTKKIRNDLSHFSDVKDMPIYGENDFKKVQDDLIKLKGIVTYLLEREKYNVILRFSRVIRSSDKHFSDLYNRDIINSLISETKSLLHKCDSFHYDKIFEAIDEIKKELTSENTRELYLLYDYMKLNNIDFEKLTWNEVKQMKRDISGFVKSGTKCQITETYDEELDAILEVESTTIIYQYLLASFKISLQVFIHCLSNLKFEWCSNSEIDNFKSICCKLGDFPQSSTDVLRVVKDQMVSVGKMTRHVEIAVKIVDFLSNDTFNLKISEGIKNIKINKRTQTNTEDSLRFHEYEIYSIFDLIRCYSSSSDNNFDREIRTYKRITELINTLNELQSRNCLDKSNKIIKIKNLIGNRDSELDLKMLKSLQDGDYKRCMDNAIKKFKGNRKCKFENLIRSFMKKDNNNFSNRTKLLKEFLFKIDDKGVPDCVIRRAVVQDHLNAIERTVGQLNIIKKHFYRKNKNCYSELWVRTCFEMLTLRIIEQWHKLGDGENRNCLFTTDPDLMIRCGKTLRNYLAHSDISYKLFTFDPDLIVACLIESDYFSKTVNIEKSNYFLRNDTDRLYNATDYELKGLGISILQDKMFRAITDDDLNGLLLSLIEGADPGGRDVFNKNAFDLALEKSSCKCYKILTLLHKPVHITLKKVSSYSSIYKTNNSLINLSNNKNIIKFIKIIFKICNLDKIRLEDIDVVRVFINDNFTVQADISSQRLSNDLHILVCSDDVELIRDVLKIDKIKTLINDKDYFGNTALHWAVLSGSQSVCEVLLNFGADPSVKNSYGYSPFDLALKEKRCDLLYIFLRCNNASDIVRKPFLTGFDDRSFCGPNDEFKLKEFCYDLLCVSPERCYGVIVRFKNERFDGAIDFNFCKTIRLECDSFKNAVIHFILSLACIFDRRDIVDNLCGDEISFGSFKTEYIASITDSSIYKLFKNLSYMHLASLGGNPSLIARLKKYFDVNDSNNVGGFTPLHMAAASGDLNTVRYLISVEADVDSTSDSGFSSLHVTSLNNNERCAQFLSDVADASRNKTKHFLSTPLHSTSLRGYSTIVKFISDKVDIQDFSDRDGNTPLHLAALYNREEVVQILLENGCDAARVNGANVTVVHCAVLSGNVDILNMTLKNLKQNDKMDVVNLKMKNDHGFNEHIRMNCGGSRAFNDLTSRYVSLSAVVYGSTALHIASAYGHCDMVRILIGSGADIDCLSDDGETPLNLSIRQGHDDVAAQLIDNKCSLTIRDNKGNLPVHLAVHHDRPLITNMILNKTDDSSAREMVNIKNKNYTPLHIAANNGNYEMARLLLASGADVAVKDSESGETPLHFACADGTDVRLVRLLMDTGSNVNARSDFYPLEYVTPLYKILSSCHGSMSEKIKPEKIEIIETLLKGGARLSNISMYDGSETLLQYAFTCSDNAAAVALLRCASALKRNSSDGHPRLSYTPEELLSRSRLKRSSFAQDEVYFEKSNRAKYLRFISDRSRLRRRSVQDDLLFFTGRQLNGARFVDCADRKGKTQMHRAACFNDVEMADILLSFGADVDCRTLKGLTPLHYAVKYKSEDIIRFLLDNKADKEIACYRGYTPLALAVMLNLPRIIKVLQKYPIN